MITIVMCEKNAKKMMHEVSDMNVMHEASADDDEKVFFYALYFDEQDRSLLLEQRRQLQQDEGRSFPRP